MMKLTKQPKDDFFLGTFPVKSFISELIGKSLCWSG
ncbi:unnamed protein product [Tenebrio molitor]|nr:unnamed protein product [Tenebrio molitor]